MFPIAYGNDRVTWKGLDVLNERDREGEPGKREFIRAWNIVANSRVSSVFFSSDFFTSAVFSCLHSKYVAYTVHRSRDEGIGKKNSNEAPIFFSLSQRSFWCKFSRSVGIEPEPPPIRNLYLFLSTNFYPFFKFADVTLPRKFLRV